MGKVVEFSATMRPSSRVEISPTGQRVHTTHDADGNLVQRATAGGLLMMQILAMPNEERREVVAQEADDELMVWFARIGRDVRREIVAAAGREMLKQKATSDQQAEDAAKGRS